MTTLFNTPLQVLVYHLTCLDGGLNNFLLPCVCLLSSFCVVLVSLYLCTHMSPWDAFSFENVLIPVAYQAVLIALGRARSPWHGTYFHSEIVVYFNPRRELQEEPLLFLAFVEVSSFKFWPWVAVLLFPVACLVFPLCADDVPIRPRSLFLVSKFFSKSVFHLFVIFVANNERKLVFGVTIIVAICLNCYFKLQEQAKLEMLLRSMVAFELQATALEDERDNNRKQARKLRQKAAQEARRQKWAKKEQQKSQRPNNCCSPSACAPMDLPTLHLYCAHHTPSQCSTIVLQPAQWWCKHASRWPTPCSSPSLCPQSRSRRSAVRS
jgi:hypothetical protein